MIGAENCQVAEKLRNGSAVFFRAVHADDRIRFMEAFKNLDSESAYTRIVRNKSELTGEALKTAAEVDFENTAALVLAIQDVKGGDQ